MEERNKLGGWDQRIYIYTTIHINAQVHTYGCVCVYISQLYVVSTFFSQLISYEKTKHSNCGVCPGYQVMSQWNQAWLCSSVFVFVFFKLFKVSINQLAML